MLFSSSKHQTALNSVYLQFPTDSQQKNSKKVPKNMPTATIIITLSFPTRFMTHKRMWKIIIKKLCSTQSVTYEIHKNYCVKNKIKEEKNGHKTIILAHYCVMHLNVF